MKIRIPLLALISLTEISLSGCSTTGGRFLTGAGAGALIGGGSAAALSPNAESRGLNALVFSLGGAVVGGALGILLGRNETPRSEQSLWKRELTPVGDTTLHLIPSNSDLPDYLKKRLHPPVLEEATEPETIGEDGTLHAPHKVYRIQRPAELIPNNEPTSNSEKNDARTSGETL